MCRQSYNEKIPLDLTATANFLNSVSDRRQNFSHKWVIFAIGPEWNLTKIRTISGKKDHQFLAILVRGGFFFYFCQYSPGLLMRDL